MKNFLIKLVHGILMAALAVGIVLGSFFYESNFSSTVALQHSNQVVLDSTSTDQVSVNRNGQSQPAGKGFALEVGDIVSTVTSKSYQIDFSVDGVIRLGDQTRLQLTFADEFNGQYSFKILEGRAWLNNLYSNAEVNLVVDGGVIFPGQSVSYYKVGNGQADIYANQSNILLGFVPASFSGSKLINEGDSQIINKLFVPQGTSATVFADKISQNQATIAKLLYSKLVKEFNYAVFDKAQLISDDWLSNNVVQDSALTSRIRDQRLRKIRTRGLKYSSLDAGNYKVDQFIQNISNTMTFSVEKVGQRNLDALYDLLYDAQYLFDYGRISEAQDRLNTFSTDANQLFTVYGEQLKAQYTARVKKEYDYLSFANPSDSLFKLKQTLEKIYLDSIAGASNELSMKFTFLTEKLDTLGYYAENKNFNDLKATFDDYMNTFKDITDRYQKEITANITLIQRQNQALDNLFMQYPEFYRQSFFTSKLLVENKYLSLLPAGNDKAEEIQSVIAQRIDFLRKLQVFFLQGDVPIIDAQNIVALLFSEIAKIQLPPEYQSAVSKLFEDRLQDYGLFSRFLNSPEYVNSSIRGATMQQRFDQFKKDNTQSISIEDLRTQLSSSVVPGGSTIDLGTIVDLSATSSATIVPISQPAKVPRVKSPN